MQGLYGVATKILEADGDPINPATQEKQLTQMMSKIATNSTDSNIVYVGRAVIGSSDSSAVWQIVKYDDSVSEVGLFADTGNYSQIWDNRESLTYL